MMKTAAWGLKRVTSHEKLGSRLKDLQDAARMGKIRELKGFGKNGKQILEGGANLGRGAL
jgi:DNA polymerase/3'-5' exonuclease PolX